jgi:hypothetical protein
MVVGWFLGVLRMRMALLVAAAVVGAGVAVLRPASVSDEQAVATSVAGSATRPLAVYVSTSGIPHADVADVERLRAGKGWNPGDPNGTNRFWRRAIDHVWHEIAAQQPNAVFATGDMVRGYWGVDVSHTGIFGPVRTFAQRAAAVRHAGNAYEGTLRRTYARHRLTVYPSMGDHEMGGLPGSGRLRRGTFRARALRAWVSTWSRNFHRPPTTTCGCRAASSCGPSSRSVVTATAPSPRA